MDWATLNDGQVALSGGQSGSECVEYSFTNWDRFRNRILYVLNKEKTYSLYLKEKEGIQPKPKTS